MKTRRAAALAAFILFALLALVSLSRQPRRSGAPGEPTQGGDGDAGLVVLRGTYVKAGYAARLTLRFPPQGGAVTGTVDGACVGPVSGAMAPDGRLKADARGSCSVALLSVDATASIEAALRPPFRTGAASFTGSALGATIKGTVDLAP